MRALRAAAICTDLAPVYEEHEAYGDALKLWQQGLQFANQALPSADKDMQYFDIALGMVEDSLYAIGAFQFLYEGNSRRAYETVKIIGEGSPKVNVLLAMCMLGLDEFANKSALSHALDLLISAFKSDVDYMTPEGIGKAGKTEQSTLAVTVCTYADGMMSGRVFEKDSSLAQRLLEIAYASLTDDKAKSMVGKRLAAFTA